uniref:Pleckstrin homology-like domain family A member 2 n=2 Tax=Neoaves TaxID=3078114 RepID=A0A8C8E875_9STRI
MTSVVFPERFPAQPTPRSSARPFPTHSSTPRASHRPHLCSGPPHRCARSVNYQSAAVSSRRMKMQAEVIREGELEKRSDSLFQLWKKKLVVLTKDSLSLFPDGHKRAKGKELGFGSILKVDCVERTGKYIYFTIVTKDRKEIDFRCPDQSCWNASITMALIDFQNKRAIQDFKSRQEMEQAAGAQERPGPR